MITGLHNPTGITGISLRDTKQGDI